MSMPSDWITCTNGRKALGQHRKSRNAMLASRRYTTAEVDAITLRVESTLLRKTLSANKRIMGYTGVQVETSSHRF